MFGIAYIIFDHYSIQPGFRTHYTLRLRKLEMFSVSTLLIFRTACLIQIIKYLDQKRYIKHLLAQALDSVNEFRVLEWYIRPSASYRGRREWRCITTYY